jgi:uncharacterized protein (TIGR02145 family)
MKYSKAVYTGLLLIIGFSLVSCEKKTTESMDDITVTDIDGNVYQTIQIGDQLWMSENLKITHYRNGDSIINAPYDGLWEGLETGQYCIYNSDSLNVDIYGNLYNWYAVNDPRGLAPDGWHIPTDAEILELEMYLGMHESIAYSTGWRGINEGSKLAGGLDLWLDGDLTDSTDFGISGFDFLPGGYREAISGGYSYLQPLGRFWSSTSTGNGDYAWGREIESFRKNIRRDSFNYHYGYSVRCVKD